MFAHSIKLGVATALGLTVLLASMDKAEAWTPCMPICDFACTAPAAISMSLSVLSSHLDLSKELLANIDAISNLSASMVNRNASISAQESLNTSIKITAFDAVSTKLSTSMQLNAIENEMLKNNHIIQLDRLSTSNKKADDVTNKIQVMGNRENYSLLTSLAASASMKKNSELMDDLLLVSDQIQTRNNGYKPADEHREKAGLLNELSLEIPNPFVTDEVDMDFYIEYQKQLVLLYNHQSGAPKTISEATDRIKKRLIINSLNLDMLQNASFEGDGSIEALTMHTNATIGRSKAESYKKLMFEKRALTSLERQTESSLLLTNTIVQSQKNLLLHEILTVKKQKNMLLALTMIGR